MNYRLHLRVWSGLRLLVGLLLGWSILGLSARAQPAPPPVVDLTLGTSTQGRPITAVRIGVGPRKLVLVGATHGWPERNTYQLAQRLIDHFRARPWEVPPAISLYIVPLLNPDGYALQRRQNANVVDLNRNMDTSADRCPENDWRQRAEGARGIVGDIGGPYSESEVESRLIRDFLLDAWAVILFHSNAGVVFPACEHAPSQTLARLYAEAAGYAYLPKWDRYTITGGMHDWAGGLGIAAVTPELVSGDQPEFEQNLAGVRAVLAHAELLPAPQAQQVNGLPVDAILWRAWRAWGGMRLFGAPLAPPQRQADGEVRQLFERAELAYHPARSASTRVVEVRPLGRELFGAQAAPPAAPVAGARFFPETGQSVSAPFAAFWQINGGLPIFGLPLAPEAPALDAAGRPVIRQLFERAVLERPAAGSAVAEVTLLPLGRIVWAQQDADAPSTAVRPR